MIGASFRFIPNPTLEAQLRVDPQVGAAMLGVGEVALENVQAATPTDTGTLRASFEASLGGGNEVEVSTDVPYWVYVEFGTSDTPTFAMMRRGLEATKV